MLGRRERLEGWSRGTRRRREWQGSGLSEVSKRRLGSVRGEIIPWSKSNGVSNEAGKGASDSAARM